MKVKLFFVFIFAMLISQLAFSSGSLRFILPFFSMLDSEMKEGEIAYDSIKKSIIFKTDTGIIPILSNPDVSYQNLFPLITTDIISIGANKIEAYSTIFSGKIRIGNKNYTNSSKVTCTFNEATPIAGWGGHDGSSKIITVPSGYMHPLYLYLAENGNSYQCIYSYKSNGPGAPYNSFRWIRVASLVGRNDYENILVTEAGYTSATNTSFDLTTATGPINIPYLLSSSMKYVKIGQIKCATGAQLSLRNYIYARDGGGSTTRSYSIAECYNGSVTNAFNYYFYDTTWAANFYFQNYGSPVPTVTVPIMGWVENALTSI